MQTQQLLALMQDSRQDAVSGRAHYGLNAGTSATPSTASNVSPHVFVAASKFDRVCISYSRPLVTLHIVLCAFKLFSFGRHSSSRMQIQPLNFLSVLIVTFRRSRAAILVSPDSFALRSAFSINLMYRQLGCTLRM